MECFSYKMLLKAASLIPIAHYLLAFLLISLVFLYNFLEIHFFRDLFTGFRGQPVSLTFNPASHLYHHVISKCQILHGRYSVTPWLSSPHLQTAFLSFFGRPPVVSYIRQLFYMSDGGTIALDWLINSDETEARAGDAIPINDRRPIVIVIPGLTSDSASAYIKHFTFKMAKRGWNAVVSNHRGLGGVSITSDCFYNAGWTEDIRKVIHHIHSQYPEAPLFAVGTSIGANILVKYLGEDGINIPIIGAAAICSPWDLLICDRFINRRLVQRFYDKALTVGLKGYAQLHQFILSRLADWEGIAKSHTVRDFDNYATRILGKYETVDTYYRRCSSANYVGSVMLPLLCISALDDPVCTREAIPWDECRANENVVLATTQDGGHLAFYEGISAKSLWWVGAVDEFFNVLHTSPLVHREKEVENSSIGPLDSSIDQGPSLNVMGDGMVTASGNEHKCKVEDLSGQQTLQNGNDDETKDVQMSDDVTEGTHATTSNSAPPGQGLEAVILPVKRCLDQLSRQSTTTIWLLAYIAIVTTWPLLGSALLLFFKKKFGNVFPASFKRR